jgi:hypothetical protein
VPAQIDLAVPALTVGNAFTVTDTCCVSLHPNVVVPTIVYVVVTIGVAMGDVQLVQDNPVAGVHVYVFAPDAVNVVELPAHIVLLVPGFTVGLGLTVTVTMPVSIHPLALLPVTIYVVVVVGLAVGFAQLVHDKPVDGVQL